GRPTPDGPPAPGATAPPSAPPPGSPTTPADGTDSDGLTATAERIVRVRPPNQAPLVTIAAPADGGTAPVGSTVTLTGSAHDDFDGDVSGRLSWTSSKSGALGTGASISTSHLGAGTHTLTASATNPDGATG